MPSAAKRALLKKYELYFLVDRSSATTATTTAAAAALATTAATTEAEMEVQHDIVAEPLKIDYPSCHPSQDHDNNESIEIGGGAGGTGAGWAGSRFTGEECHALCSAILLYGAPFEVVTQFLGWSHRQTGMRVLCRVVLLCAFALKLQQLLMLDVVL